MNADGLEQTCISNNHGQNWEPSWSPDGTKIAFTCNWDIYAKNADGSEQTDLTNNQKWDYEPATDAGKRLL
ncbi:TolB family protein [Methanocella paludicola]